MRRLACIALLAGACGGFPGAPAMHVAESCALDETRLELEAPGPCALYADALHQFRAEYEARFGRQDLTGRVVRLRAAWAPDVSGATYADAIDLTELVSFPHELNHVRTGPGHVGWCLDYNPWSIAVLGWDQSDYLGCK